MTYTYQKKPRSVSQLKTYEKCPQAYYLERIARPKVWQRPASWLPQGTAVHAVAEERLNREQRGETLTLEEAKALFGVEYEKSIAEMTEVTPNFEFWFRSGPYGGVADAERRYGIGLEQVEKLYAWLDSHPEEEIWVTPDGKHAVELEVDFDLEGIRIRGFIDAVTWVTDPKTGERKLRIRDWKTGKKPGDDFQLAVYAVGIKEIWGVDIAEGEYWMGGPGKPTYPFDLTAWPRARVAEKFLELEANIEAGRFDPDPGPSKCDFCSVNLSCPLFSGV